MKMRTGFVLVVLSICFNGISVWAQLPGTSPAPAPESQPLVLTSPQNSADTFSGSGKVDKLVPGVVQLTLLEAIDRGIQHNLGLLVSQQQSDLARAQYRRQLSALLPNITGNVNESINKINLAAFGIPLPGLAAE